MSDILPQHTRAPWVFEKFYICRNTRSYYTNFSITANYNQHIDKNALSLSLRNLMLKNPVFLLNCFRQSGDFDDDEKLNGSNYIVRVINEIRFDDVVGYETIKLFDEVNLAKLDTMVFPMNNDSPLWKIMIQKCLADDKIYISFVCDHCFFDGNSGVQFHKDLVEELSQVDPDGAEFRDVLFNYEQDKSIVPEINPAPNDLVDIYDTKPWFTFTSILKILFLPKFVIKLVESYLTPNSPNLFKYPVFNPRIPMKNHPRTTYRLVNFTSSQTDQILKYCQSNGVSLTSYIISCGMASLQEKLLPKFDDKIDFSGSYSIPICGRKYYPELKDQLKYGVFVSALAGKVAPIKPSTRGNILTATQTLHHKLIKAVNDRTTFQLVGLLKYVNVWDFLKLKDDTADQCATLELSNLGFKNISLKNWKVTNLFFRGSIGIREHFMFGSVSTENGGANLCFSYRKEFDKVINDEDVDFFIEYFSKKVLEGPTSST